MTDGARRLAIDDAMTTTRKAAKEQVLSQYPDLAQAQAIAKVRRKTGKRSISAGDLPPGFELEK